jgi:hypothetical protein
MVFESWAVIIPLSTKASTLDLYIFKMVVLTNWQILIRHIVMSRKSATLLQDSEKEEEMLYIRIFLWCG